MEAYRKNITLNNKMIYFTRQQEKTEVEKPQTKNIIIKVNRQSTKIIKSEVENL